MMGDEFEWHGFAGLSAVALYEMLRFRQAIFIVEQASAYPDLDDHDLRSQHLLVRRGGELVGYLRVVPWLEEGKVTIGRVAVAVSARRGGLARRMAHQAIAEARRLYPEWQLALSAQTYLAPFYASLGFVVASKPYDDYGVPHLDMVFGPT